MNSVILYKVPRRSPRSLVCPRGAGRRSWTAASAARVSTRGVGSPPLPGGSEAEEQHDCGQLARVGGWDGVQRSGGDYPPQVGPEVEAAAPDGEVRGLLRLIRPSEQVQVDGTYSLQRCVHYLKRQ